LIKRFFSLDDGQGAVQPYGVEGAHLRGNQQYPVCAKV
jgi:hypothetical protein